MSTELGAKSIGEQRVPDPLAQNPIRSSNPLCLVPHCPSYALLWEPHRGRHAGVLPTPGNPDARPQYLAL